jgi:Rod binding domain-containing protein
VSDLSGLPPIPETALPAAVRDGSAQDKRSYTAALGFEQVMLGQLVKAMVPESSDPASLASGPYGSAITDAFAQGISNSGGVGLAAQLFQTMQETAK